MRGKVSKGWKALFCTGPRLPPAQSASMARSVDFVSVSENAVYASLAALAAVVEEPYCLLGPDELRAVVRAHSALSRAMRLEPDYRYSDDRAVYRHGGSVVKVPVHAPSAALRAPSA